MIHSMRKIPQTECVVFSFFKIIILSTAHMCSSVTNTTKVILTFQKYPYVQFFFSPLLSYRFFPSLSEFWLHECSHQLVHWAVDLSHSISNPRSVFYLCTCSLFFPKCFQNLSSNLPLVIVKAEFSLLPQKQLESCFKKKIVHRYRKYFRNLTVD